MNIAVLPSFVGDSPCSPATAAKALSIISTVHRLLIISGRCVTLATTAAAAFAILRDRRDGVEFCQSCDRRSLSPPPPPPLPREEYITSLLLCVSRLGRQHHHHCVVLAFVVAGHVVLHTMTATAGTSVRNSSKGLACVAESPLENIGSSRIAACSDKSVRPRDLTPL